MQRLLILTLFSLISSILAFGQQYTIQGKIVDPDKQGLPNTTLLLLRTTDSTMVNYALTDIQGNFQIKNMPRASYLLRVTYIGYATRLVDINPPSGNTLDLGTIMLENERVLLREVSVQEERIPMRIKNDTIEYDALAFRPLANEVVEDLLKRMPGMEVQSDGSILAQGETVRRVLVDGKEFFGRDPKMATQNLPADAVSKVHVFDQRSEQSLFTGIDDGQRERTINLELKEDRKQGLFGNTSLAYGTEERFMGRTNINRFDKNGQFSILGMGNNVNQQGFSIGDYLNFSGAAQSLMGGGGMQMGRAGAGIPISYDGRASTNGLMNSWAGGLNLNRKISSKTELNASYFYNTLDHDITQDLARENFRPEGNFNQDQESVQENQNFNHRLNMRLDHSFSDASSILFTANTSANKTQSSQQSISKTYDELGTRNLSNQLNQAEGMRLNLESSLLWRQRLNKPGRTLTAGMDIRVTDNEQEGSLEARNEFFRINPSIENISQFREEVSYNRNLGMNATYTEPLGKRRFLEANYRISQNFNQVDQKVFDQEGQLMVPNLQLTNEYNNSYLFQRAGVNFRLVRERYNLTLGSNLQISSLRGRLVTLEQEVNRDYTNVLPVVRFNYEFNNFRRLMADYETSVQEPSVRQLQPLVDNRDPLNLYQGNPGLRPSYRHRGNIRFNNFNPVSSFGFFAFLSADYVANAITNSVSVDESLVRMVTPVNVKNNLSLRTNLNTNFNIPSIKSRMSVGTTLMHSKSINVLDNIEQEIANNTLGANTRFSLRLSDNFETSLSANVNQQLTKYEFGVLEQAFLNQTYGSETTWSFLKHYRLGVDYRYQIYEGRTAALDRNIPILDFSISRRFLKGNAGELKLTGYNLLNYDLGVSQQVDVNYIQRQLTNSLGRYFLFSFTYSLNQSLNVFEGPRPGRDIRIMHH